MKKRFYRYIQNKQEKNFSQVLAIINNIVSRKDNFFKNKYATINLLLQGKQQAI